MSSPWGQIQDTTKLARGIAFVSTASHGGIRVSRAKAEKVLTESARKRAIQTAGYYFFEEDCLYAIPLWELPEMVEVLNRESGSSCTREGLLRTLSGWNPDYLIERGDTPDPERYAQWQAHKLDETMRAQKHPDLITCAWGDTPKPGQCKVKTADGKEHVVTTESYRKRGGTPNLLSNCVRV